MKSAVQLSYLAVFAFVASARDDAGHFRDGSSSQEDTCAVSIASHAVQQVTAIELMSSTSQGQQLI